MAKKVAIVSGSNKGIGFAIVRGLCKARGGDTDVFLTARDEGRGQEAVKALEKEGLKPKFHQLDITNKKSIEDLATYMKSNYGGIDILVNNAAIAFKNADPTPMKQQAPETMKPNYYGLLDMCESLFPLLRPGARVVHVASMAGPYALRKMSDEKKKIAVAKHQSPADVTAFIQAFVTDAEAEVHESKGWPNMAYGMSKLGVIMLTAVQQEAMEKEHPGEDIIINSCCPGYVDTDMTSHKGRLTIDQGAETPLYLALLPTNTTTPKGDHCSEKKVVDWRKN